MNNTQLRKIALPIAGKCAEECYWLECDGMSNLIHYYLDKAGLSVSHHRGFAQLEGAYPVSHDWLQLGCWTIDYRLRSWYPREPRERVPNGIFRAREYPVAYVTHKLLGVILLPEFIAELEAYHPTPDWALTAEALRAQWEGKDVSIETLKTMASELERRPPIFHFGKVQEVIDVPHPRAIEDERS
jgi:hypothetical protein